MWWILKRFQVKEGIDYIIIIINIIIIIKSAQTRNNTTEI